MRRFEHLVLVVVFLLICVDVKATVPNEANFTPATAWVAEWNDQAETLRRVSPECGADTRDLLWVFISKTRFSLESSLSEDDLLSLQNALFAAKDLSRRKCSWYGFYSRFWLVLLQKGIENRLN